VIFDHDNVVVRYDRAMRVAAMAAALGRTEDQVAAAVFGSGLEDAADTGRLSPGAYLDAVGERLGCPVSRPVWAAARAAGTTADARMVALVARAARHTPVALLTNNGTLLREELATVSPEVAALGLPFHASGDLGVAKPDPEVYRRVAALHGVAPGATLFLDDTADHVDGARRAGLRAHLFTAYDAAVAFLVAEGVPVDADGAGA
jgi:putative hydrolase of the HAD superfamily